MSKKVIHINFAEMVRRKESAMGLNRRLTQNEIAEALDVTTHTVRNWMSGEITRIDIPLLARMTEYFDCDIEDILVLGEIPEGS